jgi:hypothetical protein
MACSVFLPGVAAKQRLFGLRIQNFLFRPRKKLGCPPCGGSINQMRTHPPTRHVIPIEKLGRPPIRETDLEAAALWDGFMWDDADAIGHPTYACHAAI